MISIGNLIRTAILLAQEILLLILIFTFTSLLFSLETIVMYFK